MSREKEQKYDIEFDFKSGTNLTATVCQEGADDIFKDIDRGVDFLRFYCCDGDKTRIRMSEVCAVVSRKLTMRP